MPGLLDITDDPNTAGLLSLGLRLMSTPGKFGTALGQAGLGAMGDLQQARQMVEQRKLREQQAKMQGLQMQSLEQQLADAQRAREEAQRQAERDDAFRRSIPSPQGQALQSLGADASPTLANAARLPQVDPRNQFLFDALQAGQIKPMDYFTATAPKAPEYKVVGDSLVQIGGGRVSEAYRPTQRAPMENARQDLLVTDPVTGRLVPNAALIAAKSQVAKAGASNVTVPVNTVKPLMTTVAEGLGKQLDSNLGAARAAVDTIGGAQRIRNLLDTGQVVSGPTADWRIAARQVGSVLGVGGNNDEVLANTRRTIQQLAQFELDAAQSMKGQGQITEAEREILRRAAAGNISFTEPELRALADSLEGRARKRIKAHNEDVNRLGQMPEGAQLVPFYRVSEPGTGNTVDDIVNRHRSR